MLNLNKDFYQELLYVTARGVLDEYEKIVVTATADNKGLFVELEDCFRLYTKCDSIYYTNEIIYTSILFNNKNEIVDILSNTDFLVALENVHDLLEKAFDELVDLEKYYR